MEWIIFAAIAIPILGVIAWVVLDDSFVRIEPGQLGLLLVKGRATDIALQPGPHWVPALRRREVQTYPSVEMSYRARLEGEGTSSDLEHGGPPLHASLADRSGAIASFTVRFRLDTSGLPEVHNRFGPDGIWAAVRDLTEATLSDELAATSIDDFFGTGRAALHQRLANAVTGALAPTGIVVTMFLLGDADLGRTGEVIEATARARLELERERAEAEMRMARARIDADVAPLVDGPNVDVALRYREVDSWRDLARRTNVSVPAAPPTRFNAAAADEPTDEEND